MKTYIGTKVIKAKPMTKKEYCDYRGWDVPSDEDPNEEVFLVEYPEDPKSEPNHPNHKGYISMSPKHVFDKAYRELGETSTFGMAIEAAKAGKKIARIGWNGKDMFAYLVPAGHFPSLTKHAIKAFGDLTPYRAYWALKTAQNDVAMWAPSGSDSLAEDWVILD